MGSDADGKEKLKRVRKLLGNAEINKSDSERAPEDPAPPLPSAPPQGAVASQPSPSQKTPSASPPSVAATTPPPEPVAPSQTDQTVSVPSQSSTAPASSSRISREDFETVKAFIKPRNSAKGGVENSTVEEKHPEEGVSVQPELLPKGPVPVSTTPVVPEARNHTLLPEKDELIDSLPKTAWGVKVTMKDFVFIRDHDKYCVLLKDQRTFREKFVEWMRNLEVSVTPELAAAREATLNARKAVPSPAPSNSDGDSGEHL